MCGIVGICNPGPETSIGVGVLQRMMAAIRHRGPDESGVYMDDAVGLGHVRLSVIDIDSGCQPIQNEDGTLWIVCNGEVFNYIELRGELQRLGHHFRTASDTEVILHLYEQEGSQCLERLNGQFAFAIWDNRRRELFLARDRLGIRPLHYTLRKGAIIFASEIKSIFTVPGVDRQIDPAALNQIFTFWAVLPGRTSFKDIYELPPGHYMKVWSDRVEMMRYWDIPVCTREQQLALPPKAIADQIHNLLVDSVRIRLRADVPVGCYLSGGLDSSGIAAIVSKRLGVNLHTFGIRFDREDVDEGQYQRQVASFLGLEHHELQASPERIGRFYPQTLWHCETPLLRTGPIPLFMLSELVDGTSLKVVLGGEGADEFFAGYNLFKEAKVRKFWARQRDSVGRAALSGHLYDYVFHDRRARQLLPFFFGKGLDRVDDPLFSHLIRWDNTSRIKAFFSRDLHDAIASNDVYESVRQALPPHFGELTTLNKAQFLEAKFFLSNHLLSSQGDRVAMAHSVEIRLPYLDHRVIEFMARVPPKWNILGLKEKYVLKKALASVLPQDVIGRTKRPYRAPVVSCFLSGPGRDVAMDFLSADAISAAGLFDASKVAKLLQKLQRQESPSEVDGMALAGILSSQVVYRQFIERFSTDSGAMDRSDLIVDRRTCSGAAVSA
jgi:asparagine synthase (glutamine-hydrolysing)